MQVAIEPTMELPMSIHAFPANQCHDEAACLALVLDPARAADHPGARLLAWAALKSARGQTVSQIRLRRMMDRQLAADFVAGLAEATR